MGRGKRIVREISSLSLSSWEDGVVIYFDKEKWFGRRDELSYGHVNFAVSTRHARCKVKLKEEVWTGCINMRFISTYMVLKAVSLDEITNKYTWSKTVW